MISVSRVSLPLTEALRNNDDSSKLDSLLFTHKCSRNGFYSNCCRNPTIIHSTTTQINTLNKSLPSSLRMETGRIEAPTRYLELQQLWYYLITLYAIETAILQVAFLSKLCDEARRTQSLTRSYLMRLFWLQWRMYVFANWLINYSYLNGFTIIQLPDNYNFEIQKTVWRIQAVKP